MATEKRNTPTFNINTYIYIYIYINVLSCRRGPGFGSACSLILLTVAIHLKSRCCLGGEQNKKRQQITSQRFSTSKSIISIRPPRSYFCSTFGKPCVWPRNHVFYLGDAICSTFGKPFVRPLRNLWETICMGTSGEPFVQLRSRSKARGGGNGRRKAKGTINGVLELSSYTCT